MTVAAAYLTSEGVVLGADSATIIQVTPPGGSAGVAQIFRHSQKVYEIGNNSRFGLCTWGNSAAGEISHRTIAAQLGDRISKDMSVREATNTLIKIVQDSLNQASDSPGVIGYFLGGWNPADHSPACDEIKILTDDIENPQVESVPLGEARFAGAPKFFTRVFRGFDADLPKELLASLKKHIPSTPDDFDSIFKTAFEEASAPLVAAGYKDLPIREAIDYVHSYLRLTVKVFKFMYGVPVCGGPIEVAFVSTDRHFRWVCHKDFDSAVDEEEV